MRQRIKAVVLIYLVIVGVGTLLLAATTDSLSSFGINETRLKASLAESLVNDHVPMYPSAKLYRAATPAARTAFVKSSLVWLKEYLASQAFHTDYAKRREQAKPKLPVSRGTPDEQLAKLQAEQEKNLASLKARVEKMKLDMQKTMAPVVAEMEKTSQRTKSDPATQANLKHAFETQAKADQANYDGQMKRYQERYPEDPNILIAERLRKFLDRTKDVDYEAKLFTGHSGLMRFSDKQYESKPDIWKLCFRAGKEQTEAARTFAHEWLRQLEK
jgi:hypothetical protein